MDTDPILRNYQNVLERVGKSASKIGRQDQDITIIAVTKKQPAQKIQAAINFGILNFGENYPEELEEKK